MLPELSYLELEQRLDKQKQSISKLEGQLVEYHYLAVALHDSSDAITVQDFAGNIKMWNKGAERIYGWSQAQALMMKINQIVPPYKQEEAVSFIRDISQDKELESFETRRLTADGRILDVWITATAIRDEAGKPTAVATTERDVSTRKQAEKEKNELILELQKINRQLEKAIRESKTLRGILPICLICKQIRNDKGFWEQVEVYVHNHSEAAFSHGICPDCLKQRYPKIYEKNRLLDSP